MKDKAKRTSNTKLMLRNLTRKQKLAQIPPEHASFDRKVNMQVYNRSEHI